MSIKSQVNDLKLILGDHDGIKKFIAKELALYKENNIQLFYELSAYHNP